MLFADNGSLGGQQFTFAGGILSPDGGPRTISNSMNITGAATIDTRGLDLTVNNTLAGAGSLTKSGTGTLDAVHVRVGGALSVTGGTLRMINSGFDSVGTCKAQSVSVDSGAKVDLRNQKLIVTSGGVGSWDGTQYTGLTGLIQSGRGDGSWNGNGIVTSMTAATSGVLTTLAVAPASEIGYAGGTFGGQSVSAGDSLVMYTWGGDADLNGELNGDDYFYIDSHVMQSGSVFGFHNGDFNYDGEINGDDYFILDSNILFAQNSPPFPTGAGSVGSLHAGGSSLAAVPEPAVAVLAAPLVLLLRRRRYYYVA